MEKEIKAEFMKYEVKSFNYNSNSETSLKKMEIQLETNILTSKENQSEHIIDMIIRVRNSESILAINIYGYFQIEGLDEKDTQTFLLINGQSILYPYARSSVSAISALVGNQDKPIILPIVNFANVIENEK